MDKQLKATSIAFVLSVGLFFCASCVSDRSAYYLSPGLADTISPVNDSWEPYNRTVQAFNYGFERHVANPASQIWRFILPEPIRIGLSHFNENLGYPLRLVTHALAGQWNYCWIDTKRFLVNTTVGGLGFWDPATAWGLPHIESSFGYTLARWGVPSGGYFNLPFSGPGTVRDGVGKLLDLPFNVVTWLVPAPSSYAVNGSFRLNDTAETEPTINRAFVTQPCHYELMKLLVVLGNEAAYSDYKVPDNQDYLPDQSLGLLALTPSDDDFYYQSRQRHMKMPGGRKFPYTCWPLRGAKKLVILLPGIGAHRQSAELSALAELCRNRGCAVIAISSTFTPDYFTNVPGDNSPPGFIPEDTKVLAQVLDEVVRDFTSHYRASFENTTLLGYSLGGINALNLAAAERRGEFPDTLHIDRYMAINPPVDPVYALDVVDHFFNYPEQFPEEERAERVRDIVMRLSAWLQPSPANPPSPVVPLTREESLFLVGVNMRLHLAEVLQAQEKRNPSGLLKEDPKAWFHRNNLFAETLSISFADYIDKVVVPWYRGNGFPDCTGDDLRQRCSLRALTDELADAQNVQVFHSRNDFLVTQDDLAWFETTFGPRATILDEGSHLGALGNPEFVRDLVHALTD
ncbi:MAG: alpha/beta fold hydrolase [Victivallales bacterium]|nr:alpha/beta fold hydrolase [Victivallales bacterium]